MISQSRVTILVKAYPQPSKKHQETVCCAGIDEFGNWKRLFPIRFRQLSDDQTFKRWNIVSYKYTKPTSDTRRESCSVHEESIKVEGTVSLKKERQNVVENAIVPSERHAASLGQSLALIRPKEVKFSWKRRTQVELADAKAAFEKQARQTSMFDSDLDVLEPCPYKFLMKYNDHHGPHTKTCADWETSAAFYNLSRKYGEEDALNHLRKTYSEDYVKSGLVFALGNTAKRPQTWQLLGIFPSLPPDQFSLDL